MMIEKGEKVLELKRPFELVKIVIGMLKCSSQQLKLPAGGG